MYLTIVLAKGRAVQRQHAKTGLTFARKDIPSRIIKVFKHFIIFTGVDKSVPKILYIKYIVESRVTWKTKRNLV